MLNIITVPDPKLRKISTPITKWDKKMLTQIKEVGEVLHTKDNPPGVGLSAIQTGIPYRFFFTLLPPDPHALVPEGSHKSFQLKAYINPEYIDMSETQTLGHNPKKPLLEGCLSIPHLYGPVYRSETIKIKAFDITGNEFTEELSHFPARVFQHEYDHLDAVLFTDYTLKDNLPLFFDDDDQMIEVKNPQTLIQW